MLDKTMYNSWESRMFLYIKGKKNDRMMLESIENGPLVYPTVEKEGLAVLVFLLRDDPIACLNITMVFMSTIVASRFPSTNNQLKTSSNPRNQATIQDGRVTVQQVQGTHGQGFAGVGTKGNGTSLGGNNASSRARVVKCYNCQGERHMARQCTQYLRIAYYHDIQPTIIHNAAFQTDDLDAYNSDYDDISFAKVVLMANLSSYSLDVLSEVLQHDTYQNDMLNQSVQET
ncbi:retrovirus-related pol polyprotein from transposon TNT 1-94 [Tanacetum coccineum]